MNNFYYSDFKFKKEKEVDLVNTISIHFIKNQFIQVAKMNFDHFHHQY